MKKLTLAAAVALAASSLALNANAYNLVENSATNLDLNIELGAGIFNSKKTYAQFRDKDESVTWFESYLMLDLEGKHQLGDAGTVYGGVGSITTKTAGDGDAAGFTNGKESKTTLENAYLGWQSGNLISALGQDGLDISVGRQQYAVGDGFLINSDALSFGKSAAAAIGDSDFDRGGAYWLAPRRSFDNTFIIRVGQEDSLLAEAFYLNSSNYAQDKVDITGLNLEYETGLGKVGFLGFRNSSDYSDTRDGQKTFSLRFAGDLGVENLFLSGEFASQSHGDSTKSATAGYLEAGWTFAATAWQPSLNYRYSIFSETFDPGMFGFSRGYGTWFQGEVAANYAGPFNENSRVHYLALNLEPTESLTLGAAFFNFSTNKKRGGEDLAANELDIYAEWFATENLLISPLVGLYKPKNDAETGGTQLGDNKLNIYSQLMLIAFF